MPTNRLLAAAAALLLSTGVARATTPPLFTYSGFLQDGSGNPVTGIHDFTFRFYNAPSLGSQIGTDVVITSPVAADGYFSVVVDVTGFSSSFSAQTYMAVKLDTEGFMLPRIQLTSVPGALSVPFGGVTGWPTSQCPASQFAVGYDVNGNLVCGPEGGVSSVSAGAGITVSGTSAVTVAANLATAGGDNGSASTIARSDHAHDARYPTAASLQTSGTLNAPGNPVDWTKLKGVPAALADGTDDGVTAITGTAGITASVTGASATIGIASGGVTSTMIADGTVTFTDWNLNGCTTGQIPKVSGGAWTCGADDDTNSGGTVTSVSATSGGGLAVTGTATLTPSVGMRTDCAANQLLKWNGSAWGCAADIDTTNPGTVTNVTALAPLSVVTGSTTPEISMTAATSLQPGYITSTDWSAFNAKQARVTGTCSPGYTMTAIGVNGSVTCTVDGNSGGTVTSVATGAGLTGGPITGSGTISIPAGGVTSAMIADGSVTFTDWNANGCTTGQIPKMSAGGTWGCGLDVDTNSGGTVTSVAAGAGLTGGPITSSGTISIPTGGVTSTMIADGAVTFTDMSLNGCATGQIPKVSGGVWTCSTDTSGTVTSVTAASAPLSVATGTTTPVISITQANNAVSGYLTSADWNTFNAKQARVTGTCSSGTSVTGVAADGSVTCTPSQSATYVNGPLLVLDPGGVSTILTPTLTVSVQSGQRIHWTGSAAFGTQVAGGTTGLYLWPCYRSTTPGSNWVNVGSNLAGLGVARSLATSVFTVNATQSLSTGSYQLGVCGASSSPANWNYNDYAYISAVVIN